MNESSVSPSLRQFVGDALALEWSDLDCGVERLVNQRRRELAPVVEQHLAADLAHAPLDQVRDVLATLKNFFCRHFEHGMFRANATRHESPHDDSMANGDAEGHCRIRFDHQQQFYVPRGDAPREYAFRLPSGRRVVLEIRAPDDDGRDARPQEGKPRAVLDRDEPVVVDADELKLRFVELVSKDRTTQARLNTRACAEVLDMPRSKSWRDELSAARSGSRRRGMSRLEHHVSTFTSRRAEPLFVHRDLGAALCRELDCTIQSELLDLDAIGSGSSKAVGQLAEVAHLTRRCGRTIIEALNALEEIRKRHWLRRPLVLESHWCVTLDRVPADLYPRIVRNAAQTRQWQTLLKLDELPDSNGAANGSAHANGRGARSARLSVAFLQAHPNLVVDTRHFDRDFTDRLLKSIDDLDRATCGMAIHGESFRALRLLEPRYAGAVKCAIVDPPYNTGSAALSYTDRFSHSQWLAMVGDRFELARRLLREDGALLVCLDDHEQARLRLRLEDIFGERNYVATIVWEKVHTRKNSARHFSVSHDYVLVVARNKDGWRRQLLPRRHTAAYSNPDEDARGPWKADPVYANKPYGVAYQIEKPNGVRLDPPQGQFWRFSPESFAAKVAGGQVLWGDGRAYPLVKRYLADVQAGLVPVTLFTRRFAGDNGLANAELNDLFGPGRPVAYPKPTLLFQRLLQIATAPAGDDVVLDFFAGSGTTAHAVILQNQRDGGRRKYVLVEMGRHFETVLLPRLVKVMHSLKWRGGRPAQGHGTSQLINCLRIESFDDPVDCARELDFRRPLRRAPRGHGKSQSDLPRVDLIASFNFLLGLRVRRWTADRTLCVVSGTDAANRRVLVAWRNVDEMADDELCARLLAHVERELPAEIVYLNGCDGPADDALAKIARRVGASEALPIETEFARLRDEPMEYEGGRESFSANDCPHS